MARIRKVTINKLTGYPCQACNGSMVCSSCEGTGWAKKKMFKAREVCLACGGGEGCSVCLDDEEMYAYVRFSDLNVAVQRHIERHSQPWHKKNEW